MTSGATGPWVLVLGMHRSGTSAVTGAIAALGPHAVRPEDRIAPNQSNEEHWESQAIVAHNDEVLAHFDGGWDAPPELHPGWERDSGLPELAGARRLLEATYPEPGAAVLKDPRLCLLLPYWRRVLSGKIAAVLVWRAPLAVVRSLNRRDGHALPDGLALWEYHNRRALADLAGLPTFVVDYDSVVAEPKSFLSPLVDWLGSIGSFDTSGMRERLDEAASVVVADLRRQSTDPSNDADELELPSQHQVTATLTSLAGGHESFPTIAGNGMSPWTEALIADRRVGVLLDRCIRHRDRLSIELDWVRGRMLGHEETIRIMRAEIFDKVAELALKDDQLDAVNRYLAGLKSSTSWRITAPMRSFSALLTRSRTS